MSTYKYNQTQDRLLNPRNDKIEKPWDPNTLLCVFEHSLYPMSNL